MRRSQSDVEHTKLSSSITVRSIDFKLTFVIIDRIGEVDSGRSYHSPEDDNTKI